MQNRIITINKHGYRDIFCFDITISPSRLVIYVMYSHAMALSHKLSEHLIDHKCITKSATQNWLRALLNKAPSHNRHAYTRILDEQGDYAALLIDGPAYIYKAVKIIAAENISSDDLLAMTRCANTMMIESSIYALLMMKPERKVLPPSFASILTSRIAMLDHLHKINGKNCTISPHTLESTCDISPLVNLKSAMYAIQKFIIDNNDFIRRNGHLLVENRASNIQNEFDALLTEAQLLQNFNEVAEKVFALIEAANKKINLFTHQRQFTPRPGVSQSAVASRANSSNFHLWRSAPNDLKHKSEPDSNQQEVETPANTTAATDPSLICMKIFDVRTSGQPKILGLGMTACLPSFHFGTKKL